MSNMDNSELGGLGCLYFFVIPLVLVALVFVVSLIFKSL